MKYVTAIYSLIIISTWFSSCKKFVDVPAPNTELVGATVYESNSTAAAAVTGIYRRMSEMSVGGGRYGISSLLGLSADEFTLFPNSDPILNMTYGNALKSDPELSIWRDLYNCIYQANAAIEGLQRSKGITESIKEQLIGESKFIRALCNFYLVNVYGAVPNVTTTSYFMNESIQRADVDILYSQIVSDLKDAKDLLAEEYLTPDGTATSEKVRPNMFTASALLGRVYLYQQKWDSAEIETTDVIDNSMCQLGNDLNDVFLKNSAETIWNIEARNNGFNAPDAVFLLPAFGPSSLNCFTLNDSLIVKFDSGDSRKTAWIKSRTSGGHTYYYANKYRLNYTGTAPNEFEVVFRLAEQYLIRAEAGPIKII